MRLTPDSDISPERVLRSVIEIAEAAGVVTLEYFGRDPKVVEKSDLSPLTEADLAAEALILNRLRRLSPNVVIVSEETVPKRPQPTSSTDRFWLVDPLDGTKEFIAGRDEFTVNIALVQRGRPILGVVHAPARSLTYAACEGLVIEIADGTERAIAARVPPVRGLVAVASRSHRTGQEDEVLEAYEIDRIVDAGSSLKFCLVARGTADIYPRCGPTMEWDTAAGHAVLATAGGSVTALDGTALHYGKKGFRNPYFIARGKFD